MPMERNLARARAGLCVRMVASQLAIMFARRAYEVVVAGQLQTGRTGSGHDCNEAQARKHTLTTICIHKIGNV